MDVSDATWQYNINALGPVRTVQALLPKLSSGSKIVVIGSKMGSFGELKPGPLVFHTTSTQVACLQCELVQLTCTQPHYHHSTASATADTPLVLRVCAPQNPWWSLHGWQRARRVPVQALSTFCDPFDTCRGTRQLEKVPVIGATAVVEQRL